MFDFKSYEIVVECMDANKEILSFGPGRDSVGYLSWVDPSTMVPDLDWESKVG